MTEAAIVDAALRLATERSFEDISLRAIAKELGVPVMTLYNYVANRDALHELVVNHIFREVKVPGPEAGEWHERIKKLERDVRHAIGKHPGVSVTRHGLGAAEAHRLANAVHGILTSAGFDADAAAYAFATLYTFMIGQIEVDAWAKSTGGRTDQTLQAGMGTAHHSPDELFDFGFDVVIQGLKARHENSTRRRRRTVKSR